MLKNEKFIGNWCKLSYDLMEIQMSSDCKIIFAVMQDKAKNNTCRLSARQISEITNIPIRTVKQSIKTLKKLEFIDSVQVKNGRQAFYYINPLPLK